MTKCSLVNTAGKRGTTMKRWGSTVRMRWRSFARRSDRAISKDCHGFTPTTTMGAFLGAGTIPITMHPSHLTSSDATRLLSSLNLVSQQNPLNNSCQCSLSKVGMQYPSAIGNSMTQRALSSSSIRPKSNLTLMVRDMPGWASICCHLLIDLDF